MVLQVSPDRQVGARLDPEPAQLLGRADAREQQQLRRLVGAGAEDHLALRPDRLRRVPSHDLDADGAIALEQDPRGVGVGEHLDVGTQALRREVGERGAAAAAVSLRDLEPADALLGRAVVVVGLGDPGLHGGLDHRRRVAMLRAAVADAQRPAGAVVIALAAFVVLSLLEVRQGVLISPAREAHSRPLVVVGAVAADVEHRVERARAAEYAAARQVEPLIGEAGLRLADEAPVEAAVPEPLEADRQVDLGRAVGRAGVEQEDPYARILAEPGGEDASGRAGADDDVVVHGGDRSRRG